MFYKRKYKPMFPEKYKGDPTNIIMRSSWETRFATWCDRTSSVIHWKSEETIIPYRSPIDNRLHRYFVDFQIQIRDKNGMLTTYLVEIKPFNQTKPPIFPGKRTIRYLKEAKDYVINQTKWEFADQYAKDRGWKFIVLTENELGLT